MDKELAEMWDKLVELGVSEEALQLVTNINGYSEETLNMVVYARFGYQDLGQLEESEGK